MRYRVNLDDRVILFLRGCFVYSMSYGKWKHDCYQQ
jgi:hypothetical protein